ncbi:MAG: hypothetical protein IJ424_01910 [Oscillospiraceae bacterium]|nr:hypothetical protein [Oscillospiraceae bacterium]
MKNLSQFSLMKLSALLMCVLMLVSCSANDRQAFKEMGTSADIHNETESVTVTTSVSEEDNKPLQTTNETEANDTKDSSPQITTALEDVTDEETSLTDITTRPTETTALETTTEATTTPETTTTVTTTQTQPMTTSTTIEPTPVKETDMNVIGYLTTWNYYCYKALDWDNLTHINIAFVNPDKDGVFSNDIGSDATLCDIVDTAHKNGVKVLASLGGWGGSVNYPALISSSADIDKLNANLLKFVKKFDLDGIDIDVEGDVDKDFWKNYDEWISSLRKMCDDEGLLLTTATAKWYAHYISDEALKLFDLVNIMVYDNTEENNHASMEYAKAQLDYFEGRGVEKEKLVLGVPFYARNKSFGYMSYKSIIKADESAYTRDYYGEYSYNGKSTIEAKCELAKSYGGIMIWELGDDANEPFSLLDIIGKKVLE